MVTHLHQPRGPGEAAQRHRDLAAGDEYSTVQYSAVQYSTVQYSTVPVRSVDQVEPPLQQRGEESQQHHGHGDPRQEIHPRTTAG